MLDQGTMPTIYLTVCLSVALSHGQCHSLAHSWSVCSLLPYCFRLFCSVTLCTLMYSVHFCTLMYSVHSAP